MSSRLFQKIREELEEPALTQIKQLLALRSVWKIDLHVEDRLSIVAEADDHKKALTTTIDELELSVRSFNCLKRAGINTVADLCDKTEDEMIKVRNLGKKSLEEVQEKLTKLGLSLKLNED